MLATALAAPVGIAAAVVAIAADVMPAALIVAALGRLTPLFRAITIRSVIVIVTRGGAMIAVGPGHRRRGRHRQGGDGRGKGGKAGELHINSHISCRYNVAARGRLHGATGRVLI